MIVSVSLFFFLLLQVAFTSDINLIGYFQNQCPQSWEPYTAGRDRVIVGQGKNRTLGETGGVEEVTLTIGQMPKHNHDDSPYNLLLKSDCTLTTDGSDYTCDEPDIITTGKIQPQGNNQPHTNMQPYIVLKACKKVNETKVNCSNLSTKCFNQRFLNIQTQLTHLASTSSKLETIIQGLSKEIVGMVKDFIEKLSIEISQRENMYTEMNQSVSDLQVFYSVSSERNNFRGTNQKMTDTSISLQLGMAIVALFISCLAIVIQIIRICKGK